MTDVRNGASTNHPPGSPQRDLGSEPQALSEPEAVQATDVAYPSVFFEKDTLQIALARRIGEKIERMFDVAMVDCEKRVSSGRPPRG
jgi:hypothetical protein